MWDELTVPIVIAHRGDKAFAPENTLSAFKQAAEKGADAIEFDVKLTADRKVVVLHDQTVDRTTDGTGKVTRLAFSTLRELDAGMQFPGKFLGERIPLLEEVFEAVGHRLYLNVELTNYATPLDDLVSQVADLVRRHGLEKRVFFSSFLPGNLRKAHALLPDIPRGQLAMRGFMGAWARTFGWRARVDALNPHFLDIDSGLVDRVHASGKRVFAWPVYAEADIQRMIDLGVDGIITHDPALALRLLGRARK